MGRKSKRDASAVAKVTCFYCTRQFDTESHLLLHQKSIHFKCPMCPRRFSSACVRLRCALAAPNADARARIHARRPCDGPAHDNGAP